MRLTTALLIAAGTALNAQSFTGTYTFGSSGNVSSFAYNGTDIANLTEGAIVKSAGITTSSSTGNFRATNWTTATSIDTGDYIGFSLTAADGYEIDMSTITFGVGRSGTGTRNWAWRSSQDNFASDLAVYDTLATGVTNTSGVLSHADNTTLYTGNILNLGSLAAGTTIEFRLYSWSAEAAGGSAGLAGALTFAGTLNSTTPPAQNPSTGLYWAGSGSGGAGTWTSSSTTFATDATYATSGLGIGSGTVVFAGTAGTVAISGGVSVASGLQFSTTGYILSGDTLTLSGASAANNTLTTDFGVTATVSSVIAGSAGLTKAGAGSLVLSGANSYTGGTTIAAGTLTASTASLSGAVTNNGALVLDQATDATYSGAISGTGSLAKSGAGALTLSGANTYSGGTTVSAGSLIGDTASLQGGIVNNAAVTFAQATTGTYAGSVSGTGSLTKSGNGTLTVTGSLGHSGGTTVSAGTLQVGSGSTTGSLSGDVALGSGTTLAFNRSNNTSASGAISGTGALTKSGAGALTLSGSNSYSGGTTVSAGSLLGSTASLQGSIVNNAALVFSQADDGTFSGSISGTGSLSKLGAGVVTLSNANTFSGAVNVGGGALRLGSASALGSGSVTVNGGGILLNAGLDLARSLTLGAAGGLFISEYVEGSSNNKYLELYNATGATVDLSGYRLAIYANGAVTPNTPLALSGSLAAGSVVVLQASSAALTLPNGVTGVTVGLNYNGNDAVALQLVDGTQVDVVGVIGNDPGTGWTSGGNTTVNATLVRSASVSVGNPTGGLVSLGSDWISFASDTASNLGSHTFSGAGAGAGSGTLGLAEAGAATFSGAIAVNGAATLTAAASGTATFSGVLSGAGSVTKTGEGLVVLSNANTYSGGTTVSAGTLRIGDIASLGSGNVAVSGGVLDLNNLAPTNVIVLSGGSLANSSAWAAAGTIQLSGTVDSTVINGLEGVTEVKVAAGATVNLAGVTKDIVFEGGSLNGLGSYNGKIKVKGNLDVSGGTHAGELEVASGGTLDFGNAASSRAVKFTGGAITGANFTGNVEVVGSGIALTSSIGAGKVRLTAGNSASIQAGFNRAITFEGGELTGLDNYSGALTVDGSSTLDLDGASNTAVNSGASITVASGSTLKGSGTVGSIVQSAGSILAPGNSPGLVTTGTADLAGGADMQVEFFAATGTRGTAYDAVTVTGELDLSALTNVSRYTLNLISLSALPSTQGPLAGFDGSTAYIYELFTYATLTLPASYTGSISDLFTIDTSAFEDANGNAVTGSFTVFNNTSTNTLELQYAPIPEPSTYGLMLGGLALAGAAIRRRRKNSK